MPNVTFYFEVHQPMRLKRKLYFQDVTDFIDWEKNREIFNRVADKCYIPATRMFNKLIKTFPELRLSFSFSGTFFEQAEKFRPDVINEFQNIFDTGNVDILDETYYHSLAYLINQEEYEFQIKKHREMIKKYFNYSPSVFRNTEAMYSDDIAKKAEKMGYNGIIAEGWDKILQWRSPNFIYNPPDSKISVEFRNYRLSDDISFRFSSHDWEEYPLTAEKYANWVSSNNGDTVNLFMDYETFGEHQWKETGIFEFIEHLIPELLKRGVGFNTVSETSKIKHKGVIEVKDIISWADVDRDLSAWLGNKMQTAAFEKLKNLGEEIKKYGDENDLEQWRYLQTSDNFYYMCTKWFADGDIHKYFNAYDSPYLAYINFMNILVAIEKKIKQPEAQNHTLSNN